MFIDFINCICRQHGELFKITELYSKLGNSSVTVNVLVSHSWLSRFIYIDFNRLVMFAES